jgi:hypothetical protein
LDAFSGTHLPGLAARKDREILVPKQDRNEDCKTILRRPLVRAPQSSVEEVALRLRVSEGSLEWWLAERERAETKCSYRDIADAEKRIESISARIRSYEARLSSSEPEQPPLRLILSES